MNGKAIPLTFLKCFESNCCWEKREVIKNKLWRQENVEGENKKKFNKNNFDSLHHHHQQQQQQQVTTAA